MMHYRAVGDRCAVDPLELKMDESIARDKLESMGFGFIDFNPVERAMSLIELSKYRRGALPKEAPEVVDCSSLIKWVYGEGGIWLPRYTIQQRAMGWSVDRSEITAGDIVFTTGYRNYYDTDPANNVGHVGIATGHSTIIHAANKKVGVIESNVRDFFHAPREFRGAIRLYDNHTWFLKVPETFQVEMSDDLRWLILQRI